jgi:hypothetical protein
MMKRNSFRMMFAGGIAAAGLAFAAVPAGASAATASAKLPISRAACNKAIDQRVAVLTLSKTRIDTAKRLTPAQVAGFDSTIDQVMSTLQNVNRPAVAAARTKAALKAACMGIYLDNRVYAVVLPQLFLTVRLDQLGSATTRLAEVSAEKAAAGKDVTALNALIDSANAHITAGAAAVSSVTVASYNADHASAAAAFATASAEMDAAFADVLRAIVMARDLG